MESGLSDLMRGKQVTNILKRKAEFLHDFQNNAK
jgi:hypothetical protein